MPPDSFKMDRKEINRDYEYYENKNEIKKLQERIVELINRKYRAETNSFKTTHDDETIPIFNDGLFSRLQYIRTDQ